MHFLQQNTYFFRYACKYVSNKQIFLAFYQRFKNMHVSEKLSLKKIGKQCVVSFGHSSADVRRQVSSNGGRLIK